MIGWINKKRNKKGFTLIELVVVVAILGILVALAVPRLTGVGKDAAKNAHEANIRTIESAVALYLAENPSANPDDLDDISILDGKYLQGIPENPLKTGDYKITNGKVLYD